MTTNTVLEIILHVLLLSAGLSVYTFLMTTVLPSRLLKTSYDVRPILGRGLKKFTYPEGRAVLYEARPEIRKYIERYALYTVEGYKYVQLTIGAGVKSYVASIVMVNNKNKVIGTLTLRESTYGATRSRPVRLHDATSYVAISLTSVNEGEVIDPSFARIRGIWMLLYFLAASFVTLLMFYLIHYTASGVLSIFAVRLLGSFDIKFFAIPSVFAGALSLFILVLGRMKKGVKVVLK